MCVVIVDDRLMGHADDGERNRIRDWQLHRASESWNAFAVGDYQRGWRADQSASERADIPDRNAGVSVKPQSDHQEVATRRRLPSREVYNVRDANVVDLAELWRTL